MRILYQNFTDPAVHAPYLDRLSNHGDDGFNLFVKLLVDLPGVESEAQKILDGAHARCPYSRAVRGNIPVVIDLV